MAAITEQCWARRGHAGEVTDCWPALNDPAAKLLGAAAARGGGDGVPQFPPRYRGAFDRGLHLAVDDDATGGELSPAARDMLRRRLGPEAADRFIGVVERMAAAALDCHDAG